MGQRHEYRIKSLRASSAKYGACEVCGAWAADVSIQVETLGGSHYGCTTLFGHEECLRGARREVAS